MGSHTSSRRLVLTLALVLLAAPAVLAAPGGEGPQHLVTLTLTVGQADPVTFSIPDGAMASFESDALGHRLGIIAHMVDAAAGDVDVELVDLAAASATASPAGKAAGHAAGKVSAAAPAERVTGKVGFPAAGTVGTVPVDVEVVAVAPATAAVQRACAEATGRPDGVGPGETQQISDPVRPKGCCVSCDGITVCACQVERGCGTCCGCGLC